MSDHVFSSIAEEALGAHRNSSQTVVEAVLAAKLKHREIPVPLSRIVSGAGGDFHSPRGAFSAAFQREWVILRESTFG